MNQFARHYQIPTMYRKGKESMWKTICQWYKEMRSDLITTLHEIKGMTGQEWLTLICCGLFIWSIGIGVLVLQVLSK